MEIEMEEKKAPKTGVAFVGGLVIGFLISYLVFGGVFGGDSNDVDVKENVKIDEVMDEEEKMELGGEAKEDEKMTEEKSPSTVVGTGVNRISVPDQAPGIVVVLANVQLARDGWVAIYEGEDGKPTRILGAQKFDAGSTAGVVELLRGTSAGTYYAVLHNEDGDGAFNHRKDLPLVGGSGLKIMDSFEVGVTE